MDTLLEIDKFCNQPLDRIILADQQWFRSKFLQNTSDILTSIHETFTAVDYLESGVRFHHQIAC